MSIQKCLKLALGPSAQKLANLCIYDVITDDSRIKDPLPYTAIRCLGSLFRLVPSILNVLNQPILVILLLLVQLLAGIGQVAL